MGGKTINILLACEYQIVCLGIARYLEDNNKVAVTHTVSSLSKVYSTLKANQIDIAFIELTLLKSSGLTAIKDTLKIDPGLKIIVLSRNEKEPFISKCMEFGALGFVSLKCQPNELFGAIDSVHHNNKYLSQDVAYDYAISNLDKNQQLFSVLTTREYQVFTQLSRGLTVTEIAASIHLSPKTVHVYRANIMKKLGIKNASELTLIALKHGIISIDVVE